MDIADPFALITTGHRLAESGALLTTAASAVPEPDLGFPSVLVSGRLDTLAGAADALAARMTDAGEDLAFTARAFVAADGRVGELFEQLLLGGRFS
ncbi:hypothetical protein HNR19_003756 [Nocardioides thalensis]|uniref:Uncharacterized protein n=1 Tax=Nocardioides thalensis TaxID=1914755 RepID=A0A853C9D7_9ACTN|nr:hypothetical protein [Nocardioides thalensis]NYJ03058.1 hypothetical protein [Nocardioides thalensis]